MSRDEIATRFFRDLYRMLDMTSTCPHSGLRIEYETADFEALIECVEAKVMCGTCRKVFKKEPAIIVMGKMQGHVCMKGLVIS